MTCGNCGTPFERLACQLTRGRGRFCSRECASASYRRGLLMFCDMCDGRYYRQRAETGSTNGFCSKVCYQEWRVANRGDTYPRKGQAHVHRLVAARALGRPLLPGEVVHHLDEDKSNAALENLAVFPSQAHHARCHQGGMPDDELRGYCLRPDALRGVPSG